MNYEDALMTSNINTEEVALLRKTKMDFGYQSW